MSGDSTPELKKPKKWDTVPGLRDQEGNVNKQLVALVVGVLTLLSGGGAAALLGTGGDKDAIEEAKKEEARLVKIEGRLDVIEKKLKIK